MNRNRLLNKYLLLALMLTALFAMTGCRTRITNNSEVSNVYYDEDGFLSETYQMRRDELGLSTAESPIFPDLGSGDTEEDFDSSEDTGLNYEPEEDTYVDPPTTTTTTTSPHRGSSYSRPGSSSSSSSSTETFEVILDPGEGTFEGKAKGDKLTLNITKNKSIHLPSGDNDVTRKGYTLSGWDDGSKMYKPGEEVKITKKIKFTAKWKKNNDNKPPKTKPEEPSSTTPKDDPKDDDDMVKIAFDVDGIPPIPAKKGEEVSLPNNRPQKEGFYFKCWTDGSKEYNPGDKIKADKITLKAVWDDAETHWQKEYNNATNGLEETPCIVFGDDDIVKSCKGKAATEEESPQCVVAFVKDSEVSDKFSELNGNSDYNGMSIVVISSKELAYKIKLVNILHPGTINNEKDVVDELGIDSAKIKIRKIE